MAQGSIDLYYNRHDDFDGHHGSSSNGHTQQDGRQGHDNFYEYGRERARHDDGRCDGRCDGRSYAHKQEDDKGFGDCYPYGGEPGRQYDGRHGGRHDAGHGVMQENGAMEVG